MELEENKMYLLASLALSDPTACSWAEGVFATVNLANQTVHMTVAGEVGVEEIARVRIGRSTSPLALHMIRDLYGEIKHLYNRETQA